MTPDLPAHDPHPRRRIDVLDSVMSFVDTGAGPRPPVVFLHGNPTWSYLWRNVIPWVSPLARCLAPDLIGMGQSGRRPAGAYRFPDHARYLDAWFDAVLPAGPLFLVLHDWGGALGFHWARRHADRVAGIAYMETLPCPIASWDDWPADARGIFQGLRAPAGEKLIYEKNIFIEGILPNAIGRSLPAEAHERYREPWREAGERRRPMLDWPRCIPIADEPADIAAIARDYASWLTASAVPKLFVNAEPGSILIGAQREWCRSLPNQTEVTVAGTHFIPEAAPDAIGQAVARFVARHSG